MAVIQKAHSRAKPIVVSNSATPGTKYVNGVMMYVASLYSPGGPPYQYFDVRFSEAEMLTLVASWLDTLNRQLRLKSKPSPTAPVEGV